ncbi:hypothetical protein SD70_21365 [Gordoniibacillus kamchatkensis]|uniref:Uncharacterized protein n=1 Tax=Gordoniibacillus kamchatkensis TaxID=1590651 RepID=A0ABR5ADW0_9BACL|nr:hypothetical protein [Paenibacillus sp. VKM B-2647]KIL39225.1 hypothetical protein SD70_21365 [Paenibacillus sp. VKM B-2647]
MTGTVRWNLIGGAAAFVLTFATSIARNVFTTTLLHSVYSFLLVFAVIFLFRFLLHLILNSAAAAADLPPAIGEAESEAGQNVDLATPHDDSLHDLLRSNLNAAGERDDGTGFAPLSPPKLASHAALDPEELANALRRMSQE